MTNDSLIRKQRFSRWLRGERVIRSEICSVCKHKTGVRFDEEIGYVCKGCMLHADRCSCGSDLPVVQEIGKCRNCYIVEEENEDRYETRNSSALSRAPELVESAPTGTGKRSIAEFRRRLTKSMERNGIGMDSQEDAVRGCFVFGGLSGQRRRAGMLSLGDRDE